MTELSKSSRVSLERKQEFINEIRPHVTGDELQAMAVVISGPISQEQLQTLRASWEAQHKGPGQPATIIETEEPQS